MAERQPVSIDVIRWILGILGFCVIAVDFAIDFVNLFSDRGFGRLQIFILTVGILFCITAILPGSWLIKLRNWLVQAWTWFLERADAFVLVFYRWYGMELTGLLVLGWLYLYNAIRFVYPLGYAGLYKLSIELLIDNRLTIPDFLPYYGPGETPFAYPPIGFYIAALANRLLNLSLDTYIRFAPAVWTIIAIIAVYVLGRKVFKSRAKASATALFFGLSLEIYNYHATAAGIVRGPALLWTVLALIGLWAVLRDGSKSIRHTLLAGIAMGLTAATHLAYLTFLVLMAGLLLISRIDDGFLKRLARFVSICVFGAAVSSPWWVTVINRYSVEVLSRASSTHGTFYKLGEVLNGNAVTIFASAFSRWGMVPLIGLLTLGMVYAIIRRRYFSILIFIITFLVIGEGDRFLMLIGAFIVADMVIDVLKPDSNLTGIHLNRPIEVALATLCLVGFMTVQMYDRLSQLHPALNSDLVQAAEWLRVNTDQHSSYLYFSSDQDSGEWLPYLSQRAPAVGHWGAEWNGTYSSQYSLMTEVGECANFYSVSCLEILKAKTSLSYEYILVAVSSQPYINAFKDESGYSIVFENQGYQILRVIP